MANFIKKLITYSFKPGECGVVIGSGTPPQPEQCVWEEVCTTGEPLITPDGVFIIPGGCSDQLVCYPATSGSAVSAGEECTAGEMITNNNLGWDSGAESVAVFDINTIYEFYPYESAIGIVTGITSSEFVPGYGYLHIEFAFLIDHGTARVIESGVLITDRANFTQGDKFSISVVDGFVRYFKNDVLVHESAKSPQNLPLKVDLSMYAGGDRIDNASLNTVIVQETTVSKMTTRTIGAGAKIDGSVTSNMATSQSAISSDTNLVDSNMSTGSDVTGVVIHQFAATTSSETFSTKKAIGDFHYATSSTSFEPLETLAAEGAYAESTNKFQPMETELYVSNYTPKFAIAANPFPFLTGVGQGLTGQISVSSDMAFEEMDGLAADHAYGEAETSFQPLSGIAYEFPELDGVFVGFSEFVTLEAFGRPSDTSSARLTAPPPTLTAHGGGSAALTAPTMQLTIQGTLTGVGRLNAIMPRAVLTASGTTGAIGSAELFAPTMELTALGGAGASLKAPRPYVLTASGTAGSVGIAELTAPAPILTASGTASSIGTAVLTAPMSFMMYGVARLEAPTLTLVANDVVSFDTINHVFVVNKELGEATEYTNYPASFLGTLSKTPLMIDSNGINIIGGTDDAGAQIDAFIEFAASDFGNSNQKRMMGLYFGGEGNGELNVTMRTGDSLSSVNTSDNSVHVGADTRRAKLGKGVKNRYIGVRVDSVNGAPFSIAGIEYLIGILERRR